MGLASQLIASVTATGLQKQGEGLEETALHRWMHLLLILVAARCLWTLLPTRESASCGIGAMGVANCSEFPGALYSKLEVFLNRCPLWIHQTNHPWTPPKLDKDGSQASSYRWPRFIQY